VGPASRGAARRDASPRGAPRIGVPLTLPRRTPARRFQARSSRRRSNCTSCRSGAELPILIRATYTACVRMGFRTFHDAEGNEWAAWDVRPAERQRRAPRVIEDVNGLRVAHSPRRAVQTRESWLVFESSASGEKRRVSPIPPGWERAPDAELDAMRRSAPATPRLSVKRVG
jgi:hypothetical protein